MGVQMAVLVTMMKKSMVGKPGYISEHADNVYVFDKCLKLKVPEHEIKNVKQWVCYIENSPIAMVFDVLLTKLANGYIQAFIYNSNCEIKQVLDIGEYNNPSTNNYYIAEMYNGKVLNNKELFIACKNDYLDNHTQLSTSAIKVQHVQSVPKTSKKDKKYKENLNNMSAERLAELKRQIFGN